MRAATATRWRRKAGVAVVERGDRVVALNLDHLAQPPLVFAGTAAEIWRTLHRPRNENELIAELAVEHGVDPRAIRADVRAFLEQLADMGFVTADATA